MADISQEINDFKNAIYGEEVRGSMISLAEKINTEVEANTTNVNQAVSTANSASSAANQAVADANTTLQAANQAVTSAAGHAEDAEESATAAAGSASAAAQSAADAAEVAEGLGGFNGSASSVTAQDVEGLLGTPGAQSNVQALIDAIAEQVLNQLVKKSQIINNLLATQAGNVLDATQGKALKDSIDQLNSDLTVVDRFNVQTETTESDVINWIKSFGSGKKAINLFQIERALMFGEAGNFYILLARNAIAEEITGVAINSWNQHAFSFKYDSVFSYSRLISNADLRDIFSGRDNYIDTLSSIQQLTTPGFYKIDNISSAVNDNAGSNPLSDYATGDFYGLLMGESMNSTNGCRYGTLILTSPRLVGDLWVGNIWDYKFAGWYKK